MRANADAVKFAIWSAVLSVVIGWAVWNAPFVLPSASPTRLQNNLFLVPVASAMLASRGFGWKRKLASVVLMFGVYVVTDLVAVLSGLQRVSLESMQVYGNDVWRSALTVLYATFLVTYPLVVLLFFVGKKPARLWSKDGR